MDSPNLHYTAEPFDFTPEKQPKSTVDNTNNFVIEDLLDFSNEDDVIGDAAAFDSLNGNSTDSSTVTVVDSCNSSLSGGGEPNFCADYASKHQSFPDSNLSGDLCVPYDDIAELEWLSNFVEESFSSEDLQKLQLISGMKTGGGGGGEGGVSEMRAGVVVKAENNCNDNNNNSSNPIFRPEMSVPGKARSKRSRAAPCNWSSRLLVLSPSPTSSSSESDLTSNSGKKMLKKKDLPGHGDGRKCLHCATDKTPQWRTGPLGPKTLCNACGVRYKSGRLVPEYRPASSPTFVLAKHSNSHRKVMELRRQKEMQQRNQHEHFLYPNPSDLFDVSGCADDYLIHHHPAGSGFTHLI